MSNSNSSKDRPGAGKPKDPLWAKNPLWGGRFAKKPNEIMAEINASIGVDRRLWKQDIAGSRAHVQMLERCGIISSDDATSILSGLDTVAEEIAQGKLIEDPALEDIHMHIEARLIALIGDPARRLHTARSRNDQVALDFRLWCRDAIDSLTTDLKALQHVLLDRAEDHVETVLPGMTHLQIAQPVSLGHHLLAYFEMFDRDKARLLDCRKRTNLCPLGSAALAGTGFPIDREDTAAALGFDAPTRNSLDSVSDRDFALELLSTASICALHLSRLAEELVLWASQFIGFITLPDSFSTGSSIMPQKRNPDAAELIRAKSGVILSAFQRLGVVMKGLPLAYSKDMQEDKPPVFEAIDALALSLAAMTGMMQEIDFNPKAMREAAEKGFSTATDLADWLVHAFAIPFREAHHITGRCVTLAEEKQCRLWELSLEDFQSIDPRIGDEVFSVLTIDASIASRKSYGGTAPEQVRRQLAICKKTL